MANTLIFFAKNFWVAALQKLPTFLHKIINVFENTLATTVNEFVINELVKLMMLWTTGPWFIFHCLIILSCLHIKPKYFGPFLSVDPDQTQHYVASDLGLHCLQRPICPNT